MRWIGTANYILQFKKQQLRVARQKLYAIGSDFEAYLQAQFINATPWCGTVLAEVWVSSGIAIQYSSFQFNNTIRSPLN